MKRLHTVFTALLVAVLGLGAAPSSAPPAMAATVTGTALFEPAWAVATQVDRARMLPDRAPAWLLDTVVSGRFVPLHNAIMWGGGTEREALWRVRTAQALRGEGDLFRAQGPGPAPQPGATDVVAPVTVDAERPTLGLLDRDYRAFAPWFWLLLFVILFAIYLAFHHRNGGRVVAVRVRRDSRNVRPNRRRR